MWRWRRNACERAWTILPAAMKTSACCSVGLHGVNLRFTIGQSRICWEISQSRDPLPPSARHHHRRWQFLLPGHPTPRRVCAGKRIQYVNSGTSGGLWGLAKDYNTMIAGAAHASNLTHSQPVDAALQRFQRSVMVAA